MSRFIILLLLLHLVLVAAPTGRPLGEFLEAGAAKTAAGVFAVCATGSAARLVSSAASSSNHDRTRSQPAIKPGRIDRIVVPSSESEGSEDAMAEVAYEEESQRPLLSSPDFDDDKPHHEDSDGEVDFDDEPEEVNEQDRRASTASSSGKLWSKNELPEGTIGDKNYQLGNLKAAQKWVCPCPDQTV